MQPVNFGGTALWTRHTPKIAVDTKQKGTMMNPHLDRGLVQIRREVDVPILRTLHRAKVALGLACYTPVEATLLHHPLQGCRSDVAHNLSNEARQFSPERSESRQYCYEPGVK